MSFKLDKIIFKNECIKPVIWIIAAVTENLKTPSGHSDSRIKCSVMALTLFTILCFLGFNQFLRFFFILGVLAATCGKINLVKIAVII